MKTSRRALTLLAASAGFALALTGCSSSAPEAATDGELSGASITVGSKEFTESHVLAQITSLALENAGAKITDQTGISGSATVREALETGQIDIYWDYTGTGWVNVLGNTTEELPEDLYAAVSEADAANGIAWLKPANFENTYRVAAKADFAKQNGIVTMADLSEFVQKNPDKGVICAASEFINRDDGLPGLQTAYGFKFSKVVELDLNLIYTQVGESCQFGEVFSTDARVISNDLTVIEDNDGFFVEYAGAATLRQETLDDYPAIATILAPISEALTNEAITALNGKVDTDGEDPRDVAEEWLLEKGFIA